MVGDRERQCVVGDWERERPCVVTGREREREREREYRDTVKVSLTFPLLGCFSREKVTPAHDGQQKSVSVYTFCDD